MTPTAMPRVFTPTPETDAVVAPILAWLTQHGIAPTRMKSDSRALELGNIFIAMPGVRPGRSADGRTYVDQAVQNKAAAILVEADGWPEQFQTQAAAARLAHVPVLPVHGLRKLSGHLAARYYDWPSRRVTTFGVTGTNGKTSCAHWIAHGMTLSGRRGAVLGTVGSGFPGTELDDRIRLTTPEAVALQSALCELIACNAQAVALEASSIGLEQGRLDGMHFDVAVFTNLTRDHLDYHGDMAAYEAAKTKLFDVPDLKYAVINLDDPMGERLVNHLRERARRGHIKIFGTTMNPARMDPACIDPACIDPACIDSDLAARFSAQALRIEQDRMTFELRLEQPGQATQSVQIVANVVGVFNVLNLLNVIAAWFAADIPLARAAEYVPSLHPPAGRMQFFEAQGAPMVVVDYAHTPDALRQALEALQPMTRQRKGRLWVVFGCGGERDQGKRALMGQAAALADRIVITNDNPRFEDPHAIIEAIAAGVPAERFAAGTCECIPERALAIEHATREAAAHDVVLLAGKGHENYQDIKGVRHEYSDIDYARRAVQTRHEQHNAGSGAWVSGPSMRNNA